MDGDLAEWDYGDYEGLTTAEIRTRRPGWDLFRDGCPGGEQAEDVAERAGRVIARLRSCPRLSGETAVLFAHGHVLRVLAAVWAGFGARAGGALSLTTGRLGVLSWEHESEALERWNV